MVGCGLLMILLAWVGAFLVWRGSVARSRRYLKAQMLASPLGLIAILAGWITTEVGRQPWTIQGLMRTAEAATPLRAGNVALTLALFVVVYSLFLFVFLYYYRKLVRRGPPPLPTREEG